MQVRIEELANGYVVVPTFTAGSYGTTNVNRGDMTDREWATWNRARMTPEIKAAIKAAPRPSEIPGLVLKVLEDKGVAACLINQERPTV